MKITEINTSNSSVLDTSDLMNYLAEIIFSIIDKDAKKYYIQNKELEEEIAMNKSLLSSDKQKLEDLKMELSRRKQLNIVLKLISTLNKEGVFLGKNKIKITKLLDEIEEKDFHTLRDLEQSLSLHRKDI
jgi:vacuolar-type H+-ATPase subunit I/STV1